jgi:hypothetical protein
MFYKRSIETLNKTSGNKPLGLPGIFEDRGYLSP